MTLTVTDGLLSQLLEILESGDSVSKEARNAIISAYKFAETAHRGQYRISGEPYITHPLQVAIIVARLGMDAVAIEASLLHDAVEDTAVGLEDIRAEFGDEVAEIVDGVTKLDKIKFDSRQAHRAATVRKMLIAMASDWRVLIIKLADRLHNLRTISVMPIEKQKRISQETIDIYAPLAHRLGIAEIKWQLEDLSFQILHPKIYNEILYLVEKRQPEREKYVAELTAILQERLEQLGIKASVLGRPKHLWSIYEKMMIKGKSFDEIYDLVGLRIIVEKERDCWAGLGALHSLWMPLPGRFKDYINAPKFNLYQSLHTVVLGPAGKHVEVQIRTAEMDRRAERGIAAHWSYKERNLEKHDINWLQRIVDLDKDALDSLEFIESLKLDLEQDEIYVFTPKGDVITLPAKSTLVDFAYAIHTEVGHRCIGGKIDGALLPLATQLRSGQSVEIIVSKVPNAGPSKDWLSFVQSSKARSKIRQWFSKERREDAIEEGREELVKIARKESISVKNLFTSEAFNAVINSFGCADLDSLLAQIGEGHISAKSVLGRLSKELMGTTHEEQFPVSLTNLKTKKASLKNSGIFVEGLDDVMVRLSKCCKPVLGDEIIGYVTQARGVSVHRSDCANAEVLSRGQKERLIEVEWNNAANTSYVVEIDVRALDRPGLLADVSKAMAEHHVNILSCNSVTKEDRVARISFECEISDPLQIETVLRNLKKIESVYSAFRNLPGKSG
jgi:guanosine-3',5'-bis(diphosphate) 3'-pyrophosphohydrolase